VSESYSFDEQLEFGNKWENAVKERLEGMFLRLSVDSIDYEKHPELQRAGIDHILNKDEPAVDVKTQRHEKIEDKALPFEILSVVEEGKEGWFVDQEKDTDLIVWVYPNKPATNLYHRGYIMPLKTGIRGWFKRNGEDYPYRTVPNTGIYGEYTTGVRWVDIPDIPNQYLVEFDPRLPTEKESPQSDITEWTGD